MKFAPGTRLGPYEIEGRLGAGGMGEVYRARDTRLGRRVAVKVLPPQVAQDPDRRLRLKREARAIASVAHTNICTLHDIGHDANVDYLVMELVEGETLASRLARGALPLDLALRYASQIASALNHAHRAGIVHRDLKPLNIMLTRDGVKLLDFGLAKSVSRPSALPEGDWSTTDHTITEPGMVLGTIPYMAPEQLDGAAADTRTDIFAFGAVLFEMITGRRAFDAPTRSRLIAQIHERQPPDLTQLQPVPSSLERLVRRCLAKSPDDRWQSAADLGSQIDWVREHDLKPESPNEPEPSLPPFLSRQPIPSFSGKAIASLVTAGLLALVPIVPIVLGHLARRDIRRSDGALRGGGMAVAALIIGYSLLAIQILGVVLYMNRPPDSQPSAGRAAPPAVAEPVGGSVTTGRDAPSDPAAEINAEDARALALIRAGQSAEAVKIYESLVAKHPNVHRLHVRLAEVFADQNNIPLALTHIRTALLNEPENADFRILEAELALRLGDAAGAQKILDGVDMAKVTNPRSLESAAVVRINSGDKKYAPEAVRILSGLIGQHPAEHGLLFDRARAYLLLGQKGDARRDLERFVANAPENSRNLETAKKQLEELKRNRPWWKF